MRYGCIVWCGMVLLFSCEARPSFEQGIVHINGHVFAVDIARTPEQHRYGLMNRKSLGNDAGMLFIFENETVRRFWMKDTLIDLQIAFIDSSFFIVDIQSMQANTLTEHVSRFPAQYALEVGQGVLTEKGIQIGDAIVFSPLENQGDNGR